MREVAWARTSTQSSDRGTFTTVCSILLGGHCSFVLAMAEQQASRIILMPVDASNHSEDAFDWYCSNMHHPEDKVVMIHAVDSDAIVTMMAPGGMEDGEFKNAMNKHAKEVKALEEKYDAKAKTSGIVVKFECKSGGKAGEIICKSVHDENADMVVMGCRGLGTIRRTFLGSVSDFVLHHANVPVIVIPPKK